MCKGKKNMSIQKHSLDRKQLLSQQLYDSGYLWSYKAVGNNALLPDEELILNGLSHLEFEDMPMLFKAFPYRQIKQVWQQRMLPYPDYYGVLNLLLAALFFHIKSPKKYIAKYLVKKDSWYFDLMQPKYDVSPEQMADYFMGVIAARKK